ncbi:MULTISPECIES: flagellar hook-length control protein FliK [unclassified Pseudomonas]|uniref:flagellar hook-length control protein FliK n=1 Tax=unclassified Pseudomonas TaxID=196821 RepID=UPI000B86E78A|nr:MULTISPECIES: flagellar hook-length control protein FliK [unclassified Pseudomonas]
MLGIGELFASELDSVAQQQDARFGELDPLPEVAVEAQADPDDTAQIEPTLEAEQWLLSMLGQREVQLQARDAPSSAQVGPAVISDATTERGVVLALPLDARLPAPDRPTHSAGGRVTANDNTMGLLTNQPVVPDSARSTALPKAEALLPTQVKPVDVALLAALEPLEAATGTPATEVGDSVTPASSTPLQSASAAAVERSIRLQGPEAKWGEQMLGALREHVELQVQQRVQNATIRLDPPELGSMEIFLSHESGRLSVQITASQADVARLLQHTSERLRQELVGQHFTQVSVGVSSDGQSSQQHAQQGRARFFGEAEIAANQASDARTEEKAAAKRDVLITV